MGKPKKEKKRWTDISQYGESLQVLHDEIMNRVKKSKSRMELDDILAISGKISHLSIAVRKLSQQVTTDKRIDQIEALLSQIPPEIMAKYVRKEDLKELV